MQVRITDSIASADWSYAAGQVVEVGDSFSPAEIPAEIAAVWLESGIATATGDETATLKRKRKA